MAQLTTGCHVILACIRQTCEATEVGRPGMRPTAGLRDQLPSLWRAPRLFEALEGSGIDEL